MKAILKDKYYSIGKESRCLVQTCSHIKDRGIKLLEVHRAEKGVDPDLKPEWIVRKAQKLAEYPGLEQDREDPSREIGVPVQKQAQFTEENHVREQLVSEQRKDIGVPQVSQNTKRTIEQGGNTTPKYVDRPQVTEG